MAYTRIAGEVYLLPPWPHPDSFPDSLRWSCRLFIYLVELEPHIAHNCRFLYLNEIVAYLDSQSPSTLLGILKVRFL